MPHPFPSRLVPHPFPWRPHPFPWRLVPHPSPGERYPAVSRHSVVVCLLELFCVLLLQHVAFRDRLSPTALQRLRSPCPPTFSSLRRRVHQTLQRLRVSCPYCAIFAAEPFCDQKSLVWSKTQVSLSRLSSIPRTHVQCNDPETCSRSCTRTRELDPDRCRNCDYANARSFHNQPHSRCIAK